MHRTFKNCTHKKNKITSLLKNINIKIEKTFPKTQQKSESATFNKQHLNASSPLQPNVQIRREKKQT